jgi:hypothetical protein
VNDDDDDDDDPRPPWGSGKNQRGSNMINFARGSNGRMCDLSPGQLDMLAEAVVNAYPRYLTRPVRELLVSGRYRRSRHPLLRDATLADVREACRLRSVQMYARRKEMYPSARRRRKPTQEL